MQYLKAELTGKQASVIISLLQASAQISLFLRHSPVVVLESFNKFGDQQLHQDVQCDLIVQKHLRKNQLIKGFASEERPAYHQIGDGQGFVVTYDPLDGSSIIDTNFAIGSIYSIWQTDQRKLIGSKLSNQLNAMIVVYGPRTTAIYFNSQKQKVQELTLIDEQWIVSHDHLIIKDKTKMFSPGNLRAATESQSYAKVIQGWIKKGYTLRYTGGMVPDVAQIFLKGEGIFANVGSAKHKCKLRALYEAAAVGFLCENAGGKTITTGKKSLLDFQITSYDDRLGFGLGSKDEVEEISHLF